MEIVLKDEQLVLDPSRAIYWEKQKALLLSDVHVGKAAHFRQNGIAIHNNVNLNNLWKINELFDEYKPEQLIVLGDLSHHRHNDEWNQLVEFRRMFQSMDWILVDGNHDRLENLHYEDAAIQRHSSLALGPYFLVHDLEDAKANEELYTLSGHIHPAVRVRGSGRQSMRLDCFFFGKNHGVLPAFGEFTGRYTVKPGKGDRVYAIAGTEIVKLN